jgi:hypothetical protein
VWWLQNGSNSLEPHNRIRQPMSQATKKMDMESIMNVHGPIMMIMFHTCHVIIHLFEITNNKMLERLQQFDFGLTMHYIKGKENILANALSCWSLANAISMVRNVVIEDIQNYYVQDEWFKENYESLKKNGRTHKKIQKYVAYIFNNDKLYYDIMVSIFNFEDFCVYILSDYHNIPIVGYQGI